VAPPDALRLGSSRKEVRPLKKLILRVVYSTTVVGLLVFALGAGNKHPH
jgi:hypothetical protein